MPIELTPMGRLFIETGQTAVEWAKPEWQSFLEQSAML
jgi:hypothetical protein